MNTVTIVFVASVVVIALAQAVALVLKAAGAMAARPFIESFVVGGLLPCGFIHAAMVFISTSAPSDHFNVLPFLAGVVFCWWAAIWNLHRHTDFFSQSPTANGELDASQA